MMEHAYPFQLRAHLWRTVSLTGPMLIQAGHFILFGFPEEEVVVPAVRHETKNPLFARWETMVSDVVGVFPAVTWRLGVELVREAPARGVCARLITLVNDWQYIPSAFPGGRARARNEFYAEYGRTLPSYSEVLRERGVEEESLGSVGGPYGALVSENWLRSKGRWSRALKFGAGESSPDDDVSCASLTVQPSEECGPPDSASDCVSLVAELVRRAGEAGVQTIVNFHPRECEGPVQEGSRIGCHRVTGPIQVINVGLPCSGEADTEALLANGARVNVHDARGFHLYDWHPDPA